MKRTCHLTCYLEMSAGAKLNTADAPNVFSLSFVNIPLIQFTYFSKVSRLQDARSCMKHKVATLRRM